MNATELWNYFIVGFCKVNFLCYAREPNWLGWAVIGFGGLVVFSIVLLFFGALMEDISKWRK